MECSYAVKASVHFEANFVLNVGRSAVLEKQVLYFSIKDM